jgi:hypothetical protein
MESGFIMFGRGKFQHKQGDRHRRRKGTANAPTAKEHPQLQIPAPTGI